MTHTAQTVDTPDGPFTAVAAGNGAVIASGWTASVTEVLARVRAASRPRDVRSGTLAAMDTVHAFYAGDLDPATGVPVELHGTDGQLAGWQQLRRIPAGEPLSYTEFARALGNPRAVRAAASVCARNPVALFVPCHRVLRADGSLGGFAWGMHVKRSLLDRESGRPARGSGAAGR